MLIDLSVLVSKQKSEKAFTQEKSALFGHLGTHLDTMNREFPLHFMKREAIVFNVKGIINNEINLNHIDLSLVKPDMFVAFYSGFPENTKYGSKGYFSDHPQLSHNLIDALLDKNISLIGIDFAGVRRGKEHTPKDEFCANRGVFIVENLCNLDKIILVNKSATCILNTYPVKFEGLSGLPCRVVAEI